MLFVKPGMILDVTLMRARMHLVNLFVEPTSHATSSGESSWIPTARCDLCRLFCSIHPMISLCTVRTVVKSGDSDTLELFLMVVEITPLGAVIGKSRTQDVWEDLSPVHSFTYPLRPSSLQPV